MSTCVRCGLPVSPDRDSPNYGGVAVTSISNPILSIKAGDHIHHGDICAQLLKADLAQMQRRVEELSAAWKPIESAPRNEWVLITYPIYERAAPYPFKEYLVLRAKCDELGWDTGTWRTHETPHHWQPLPAAPPFRTDEPGPWTPDPPASPPESKS